jgi:hypothetical protein
MIRFSCPACGVADSVPVECAGWTTTCRRCYHPILVPHANGPDACAGGPQDPCGPGSFLHTPSGPGHALRP